jgi:hypothetical protein
MTEVRSALPYISHIRVTKRPTRRWEPSGYQNRDGQDLYQQVTDLPGIECEITPYMGTVKGPASTYRFPSRQFFEDALAELEAKASKSDQDQAAITNILATLNRTDVIWTETILLAGNLPTLSSLWTEVFSDALDEFTLWKEANTAIDGIPLFVKEMQWDARIPYESSKSISLKVGLYNNDQATGTPELYTLNFEDAATKSQRESYSAQLQQRIEQLAAELDGLPSGTVRTQKQQELERFQTEKSQRDAIENGLMTDLLANASVQQSLPTLLLSILGTLKSLYWPELDMQIVQDRLQLALTDLATA